VAPELLEVQAQGQVVVALELLELLEPLLEAL